MARPSAKRSAAAATSDSPAPVPVRGAAGGCPTRRASSSTASSSRDSGHAKPSTAACHAGPPSAAAVSISRPSTTWTRRHVGLAHSRARTSSSAASIRRKWESAASRTWGAPSSTMAPSSTTSTRSKVRVVADVVADAQERGIAPVLANERQQRAAGGSIEPAERLVEHDEPDGGPQERPAEPHALALASRDQRAALAERRLQAVRQLLDQLLKAGGGDRKPGGAGLAAGVAVLQILEQRSIPELDRRVHPGRYAPEPGGALGIERIAVDQQPAGGRLVPAEQQADQRRLPRTRCADDGDVRARRNREVDLTEQRPARRLHPDALHDDRRATGARRSGRRRGCRCRAGRPATAAARAPAASRCASRGYCRTSSASSSPSTGTRNAQ